VNSDVTNQRPEWFELSDILERARTGGPKSLPAQDLARLGPLYRMAASDLALARSRGADEWLVSFLNDLVARGHGLIYTSPPSRLRQALRFFVSGFPALVRKEAPAIWTATGVLLIGAVLAFIIVWRDPSAQSAFVPPIFRGGGEAPHSAPKSGPTGLPDAMKPALSSFIMTNNIQVSITAFASGITFGLLTIYLMLQNGMMLGGLAAQFCKQGNGVAFWSLILPHGVIEMTAIAISGGAGLILAAALIKPGNLSRWESLKLAARRAIPLMAGVAMMLVLAGAIEGFLTPSKLSNTFKLSFGVLTGVLLVLYFISGRGMFGADQTQMKDGVE